MFIDKDIKFFVSWWQTGKRRWMREYQKAAHLDLSMSASQNHMEVRDFFIHI
jgi:hypothetical protein